MCLSGKQHHPFLTLFVGFASKVLKTLVSVSLV